MTKLLYIKASPRGIASKSNSIADAYLNALREKIKDLAVDVLDLPREQIPEFDGNKVDAKMAVLTSQDQNAQQKTAWDEINEVANRFIEADRYLIATPMWNGGIPYRLKQYIDVIHQPGLLWGLDPASGYFGLLKNKKAVLALTAGAFGPSMPQPAFGEDFQGTYLRFWLNQAGVSDIEEIRLQPSLLTPDPDATFAAAVTAAKALAAKG